MHRKSVPVPVPAELNLYLEVAGRRCCIENLYLYQNKQTNLYLEVAGRRRFRENLYLYLYQQSKSCTWRWQVNVEIEAVF
jgi:hypothetical protein